MPNLAGIIFEKFRLPKRSPQSAAVAHVASMTTAIYASSPSTGTCPYLYPTLETTLRTELTSDNGFKCLLKEGELVEEAQPMEEAPPAEEAF